MTKSTTPRAKKLTLKQIQKEHKQLNKMASYVYDDANNITIKYYEQFSESKIDELLLDLYDSMKQAEDDGLDYFEDEARIVFFVHFLIIKHFTDFKNEIPNDFPTQHTIMKQFYDKGIYYDLMNNMFDGNEVTKVIERVEEKVGMVNKIMEATQKELAKLERLENKEILKPFNVLASPTDGMLQ